MIAAYDLRRPGSQAGNRWGGSLRIPWAAFGLPAGARGGRGAVPFPRFIEKKFAATYSRFGVFWRLASLDKL